MRISLKFFCFFFCGSTLLSPAYTTSVTFSDVVAEILFDGNESSSSSIITGSVVMEVFDRLWVENSLRRVVEDVSETFPTRCNNTEFVGNKSTIILELMTGNMPGIGSQKSSGGQRYLHGIQVQYLSPEISICIHAVVSKAISAVNVVSDLLFWLSPSTELEADEESWFSGRTFSKIHDWRYWISLEGKSKVVAREQFEISNSENIFAIINSNMNRFARTNKCRIIGGIMQSGDVAYFAFFDNIYDYIVDETLPVYDPLLPVITTQSTDLGIVIRQKLYSEKYFSVFLDQPIKIVESIGITFLGREPISLGMNMGIIPRNFRTITKSLFSNSLSEDREILPGNNSALIQYSINSFADNGTVRFSGFIIPNNVPQIGYFEIFLRRIYLRGLNMRELVQEWFSEKREEGEIFSLNISTNSPFQFYEILDRVLEDIVVSTLHFTDCDFDSAVFRSAIAEINIEENIVQKIDSSLEYFLWLV